MNIIKRYKNLKLIIEDSLLESIYQSSVPYYPKEFGGFLLGRYTTDLKTLYIKKSILATSFTSSRVEFTRENNYSEKYFQKLFIDEGMYYIGEWHTHPDNEPWFSTADLNAMLNIQKNQSIQIENPILLILSVTKNKLQDYKFFVLHNDRLEVYE